MKFQFAILALCFFSCKSQEIEQVHETKAVFSLRDSVYGEIKSLLPDTSHEATSQKELGIYIRSFYPSFGEYISMKRDSLIAAGINPSLDKALEEATILMDDYQQYLGFKLIKNSTKNVGMMNLLADASPYSKLVTIDERLDLFKVFPKSIQDGLEGKRTWEKLANFSRFNIGKKLPLLGNAFAFDSSKEKKAIVTLFNVNKKTLLIFGASWCAPCVRDELKLKENYSDIDANSFEVIVFSIDKNEQDWRKYYNKHSFPWKSYVLVGGLENPLCKFLNMTGVPKCFIVEKDGTISNEGLNYEFIL